MGLCVKICGICSREDAMAVAAFKPDAMGFVFWPQSKRVVAPEDVATWTRDLPADILKVGVFVDAPAAEIRRILETAGLTVAQLHGSESPELCRELANRIWKVLHLDRDPPVDPRPYRVDAFMLDSYSTQSPGGTGRVSDWNKARTFVQSNRLPVILAGGLTPDNVEEAIRKVGPWGVDVSSGVEDRPRHKDLRRVKEFIEKCRNF